MAESTNGRNENEMSALEEHIIKLIPHIKKAVLDHATKISFDF